MTEEKKKRPGRYTIEKTCAQVEIPTTIFDAVKMHCMQNGMNMSTYWRKWIIEGYKEAVRDGEIK